MKCRAAKVLRKPSGRCRHCPVCGEGCGGSSLRPSTSLLAFLRMHDMLQHPARSGAVSFLCETCGQFQHVLDMLARWEDMVAAGLLHIAMRLFHTMCGTILH